MEWTIPRLWYHAVWSHELPRGAVRTVRIAGKDLVLFRGEDGQVGAVDAMCPHLGAHLGVGGKVRGCGLVCPFHGWVFDGQGTCLEVPYAKKIPPKARIGAYPTLERNTMILVNMAEEGADVPEIPVVPQLGDPAWSAISRRQWEVRAPMYEMAENAADTAHFVYIHGAEAVPTYEILDDSQTFHIKQRSLNRKFGKLWETEADITIHQPGFSVIRFQYIADILLMATTTPVDEKLTLQRFAFVVNRNGPLIVRDIMKHAVIAEISRQFEQDIPIWENKVHLPIPVLCDGDGPVMKLRKWYKRFGPTQAVSPT